MVAPVMMTLAMIATNLLFVAVPPMARGDTHPRNLVARHPVPKETLIPQSGLPGSKASQDSLPPQAPSVDKPFSPSPTAVIAEILVGKENNLKEGEETSTEAQRESEEGETSQVQPKIGERDPAHLQNVEPLSVSDIVAEDEDTEREGAEEITVREGAEGFSEHVSGSGITVQEPSDNGVGHNGVEQGATKEELAGKEAQQDTKSGMADTQATIETDPSKRPAALQIGEAPEQQRQDVKEESAKGGLPQGLVGTDPENTERKNTVEPGSEDLAGDKAPGSPPGEKIEGSLTKATPQELRASQPHTPDGDERDFPSSPGIDRQKAFWIEIFTRYNSQEGVLHDRRIALPVYESIVLEGMRYRTQMRQVRRRKQALTSELRALAASIDQSIELNEAQQTLLAKLPEGSTPSEIRDFARNIRFQRGLADRFRKGLIRSGALLEPMRASMIRHGVPGDLVYLPHVESTFNNATRSKAGAVGIWQFTRGTGKRYMKVGYALDERLDPLVAAEAAAKFLRKNFESLGSWPLAITAYNHGPNSLRRISRRLGTIDLGILIKQYNGRLFKFASKNFYAEFLAAREVAKNPEAYFSDIQPEAPWRYAMVTLPFFLDVGRAVTISGVSQDELRRLNPALRSPIWGGTKFIPSGYALRLPAGNDASSFLASVPEADRQKRQKRSAVVRVGRGDSLYSIGRRLGISWRKIAVANNISAYHRLMPGQKLLIPWDGKVPEALRAKLAEESKRKGSTPLIANKIVARIPVQPGEIHHDSGELVVPEHSSSFQELRVVNFDAKRNDGEIVAAYGETLGKYANWAEVPVLEIRRLNSMSSRRRLRPGYNLLIPLDHVSRETFDQRRLTFHRDREAAFFAENDIKSKVKVEVQRGQSPWNLAQNNNVPMWLFYKENPGLLKSPLKIGMQVILPVVVAGASRASTLR